MHGHGPTSQTTEHDHESKWPHIPISFNSSYTHKYFQHSKMKKKKKKKKKTQTTATKAKKNKKTKGRTRTLKIKKAKKDLNQTPNKFFFLCPFPPLKGHHIMQQQRQQKKQHRTPTTPNLANLEANTFSLKKTLTTL